MNSGRSFFPAFPALRLYATKKDAQKNSHPGLPGDCSQKKTPAALVSGEDMSFRIVWKASDGDARGWFTVGSGLEYTFTLTPGVVERAYRAVLFLVD